jgi:ligand-binding sensor domain-containing protein
MSPKLLPLAASAVLLLLAAARAGVDEPPRVELQGEPVSIIGNELTSLAFDRDETLWIGSRYRGICACRNRQYHLYNAYNSPIPDEGISAIYVDRNNTKWFGSERGYLYSFDGKRWHVYSASQGPRDSVGRVACIRGDSQGRIWFTTDYGPSGLYRLENGKVEAVDPIVKTETGNGESPNRVNSQHIRRIGDMPCLDVDRHGKLWVACHWGLFRLDGQDWIRPGDEETQHMEIPNLCCKPKSDEIYLIAAGVDFKENPFGLPTAKLCVFKANRSSVVTDKLPKSGIEVLRADQDGRFAIGYMAPDGAIIGDGQQVQRYSTGTPLENETVTDIAFDKHGGIWFAGRFRGLCCLDNGKWRTFAPSEGDNSRSRSFRLPAWQKKPLQDLVREEAVDVDIHKVLQDPRKYADKKLRIVGTIASGFEYAEMVDSRGERLGIWPEYSMLRDNDHAAAKDKKAPAAKSPPQEFLGYLEWGGYYGHIGAWPMQFTIVEVYPTDMDKVKKAETKKQYLMRIEKVSYDWPVSQYLPDSVAAGLRTPGWYICSRSSIWKTSRCSIRASRMRAWKNLRS